MKTGLVSAAFAGLVAAAPTKLAIRADLTDADILNYALTLEHLEDVFYREALDKFDESHFAEAGYDATFYKNLKTISYDETTHVSFLTEAIKTAGYTPVSEGEYDFGYTDVKSFLATASILEGVGVSAYLGAAASIVEDAYLTAAGSILTVEARHSSYLRAKLEQVPFPSPFDVPLTFNEVYTLAAQFIVSLPDSDPKLPLKPFPAVTAKSNDAAITTGSMLYLEVEGGLTAETVAAAFITVVGPVTASLEAFESGYHVTVPEGISGQSYVVLTNGSPEVSDDTTLAGPAIVEVTGPETPAGGSEEEAAPAEDAPPAEEEMPTEEAPAEGSYDDGSYKEQASEDY